MCRCKHLFGKATGLVDANDAQVGTAIWFTNATGITVAAADKGQFAVSDDKIGSIFTFNFTNNLKILMFADDIVLFGDSHEELEEWLNILESFSKATDLTMNQNKSFNN